ncbi:hypothetical protein DYB37_006462 [Aphanomyces astaci]|uniref:Uncharacterized protein n=1 Tax=Aphanomyces astaci TaxID=112090 RepID=A0A3R6XCB0_APHAT|nr:hypothetical protein DYB35_005268 [Aphanomyces astaci]RHZ17810.1 hypothetical protein DYB37_006462 [Aphanomyces astaci]
MERHLSVLLTFLSTPSVHFFSRQLPNLHDRVVQRLLQPMVETLSQNHQRPPISVPMSVVRNGVVSMVSTCDDVESLKSFCFDLALSSLTLASLHQHVAFFSTNAGHLLDRDALYEAFVQWIQWSHRILTNQLALFNMTLPQLTKTIMQSAAQLRELNPIDECLQRLNESTGDRNSPGFDYFVAQLREVYMVLLLI